MSASRVSVGNKKKAIQKRTKNVGGRGKMGRSMTWFFIIIMYNKPLSFIQLKP